jgi:type I restriction enzyme R subunit
MQARFHRAWIEATHQAMSTQALGSERVRDGLKDILLGPARLYEALRERSGTGAAASG